MKSFMRKRRESGFTLIELMIVVAIVAILALLAVFGVSKFLANAKTAEATNTLGQLNKLSISAYERENAAPTINTGLSTSNIHEFCASSTIVPAAIPSNKKYTPTAADYQTGSSTAGWKCLKHEMVEPQFYQYAYTKGNAPQTATPAPLVGTAEWLSEAAGDLDGDGTTSSFITGGQLVGNHPTTWTQISQRDPEE
jgi:type IV pilus assembly protein PilA